MNICFDEKPRPIDFFVYLIFFAHSQFYWYNFLHLFVFSIKYRLYSLIFCLQIINQQFFAERANQRAIGMAIWMRLLQVGRVFYCELYRATQCKCAMWNTLMGAFLLPMNITSKCIQFSVLNAKKVSPKRDWRNRRKIICTGNANTTWQFKKKSGHAICF